MKVEIGAEAKQFPEKEYINGIAVAVWYWFSVGTLVVHKIRDVFRKKGWNK